MATTKEYKDYILDKLSVLETIKCRPMMGEYHIIDIDNRDLLKEIILETIKELPVKKK